MTSPLSNPNIFWTVVTVIAALSAGTVLRFIRSRKSADEAVRKRLDSLKTWWGLLGILLLAILSGRLACTVIFAGFSGICFWEFARLHLPEMRDANLRIWGYVSILLCFVVIELDIPVLSDWGTVFAVLVFPVLAFASLIVLFQGDAGDYVRRLGAFSLGFLVIGLGLAHVLRFFHLPPETNPNAGAVGWLLFLVLVTEVNDIAQSLIGGRFGKRAITPGISPNKTWEGFLGGLGVTIVLAVVSGHWLTPFDAVYAACVGGLMALTGFLGDLTASAIKRDAGVKDFGRLLPGHGGLLDRLDSLTFTAPALYYAVAFSQEISTV